MDNNKILQDYLDEQWIQNELKQQDELWNRDKLIKDVKERRLDMLKKNTFDYEAFSYDNRIPFEELTSSMQPLLGYEGLIYYKTILNNPDGKKISNSVVHCDIVGYLDGSAETIDNTLAATDSNIMDLSLGSCIEGLRIALNSMRESEVTSFIVDPKLAYGQLGAYPYVPSQSKILYKIRVNKVWGETQLLPLLELERIECKRVDDDVLYNALVGYKDCANELFKSGHYKIALQHYRTILKCLNENFYDELVASKSSPKFAFLLKVLLNLAATYLKLEKFNNVSKCSKDVLNLDQVNLKALYMLSKAKLELKKLDDSLGYLRYADKLNPGNKDFDDIRWDLYRLMHEERQISLDLGKDMMASYLTE